MARSCPHGNVAVLTGLFSREVRTGIATSSSSSSSSAPDARPTDVSPRDIVCCRTRADKAERHHRLGEVKGGAGMKADLLAKIGKTTPASVNNGLQIAMARSATEHRRHPTLEAFRFVPLL